jgi:elongation factor P--beta-lysine ligase
LHYYYVEVFVRMYELLNGFISKDSVTEKSHCFPQDKNSSKVIETMYLI